MKVIVKGIDWETDGEDVDLPSSVTMEVADDVAEDDIIDQMSDEYGWLVNGVQRIIKCLFMSEDGTSYQKTGRE
jgi:hypothetical protein